MSVVRIKETEGKPQSGGGMDRVVERKGLSREVKTGLAAAGVLLLALFYWFAPAPTARRSKPRAHHFDSPARPVR